jgi:hypothetical protein
MGSLRVEDEGVKKNLKSSQVMATPLWILAVAGLGGRGVGFTNSPHIFCFLSLPSDPLGDFLKNFCGGKKWKANHATFPLPPPDTQWM